MTLTEYRNMMLRPTKFRELADVLYELENKIDEGGGASSTDIAELRQALSSIESELANIWVELGDLSNRISDLENA